MRMRIVLNPTGPIVRRHKKILYYLPVATIIADDYKKFFNKLTKEPITKEQLKEKILATYYNFLDI